MTLPVHFQLLFISKPFLIAKFLTLPYKYLEIQSMCSKSMVLTLIVLLACTLPGQAIIDRFTPTIQSVSTIAGLHSGSQEGGTILVIKGTSFNPIFTNNKVWVGPYPCQLMADGSTENYLSCRTTYPYDTERRYGLQIHLEVDGKNAITCATTECKYSYAWDQTPIIQQICPRTSIPGEIITLFGAHRITDLGDALSNGEGQVQKLKIGSNVCSMIDLDQKTSINPDNREPINCEVLEEQEAGEYSFTQLLDPGYARLEIRTQQSSFFTGNNYTQRSIPLIQDISAHSGGDLGHKLEVTGFGFSSNLQAYSECQIAGESCEVESYNNGVLTISVPEKSVGNTEYNKLPQHASDIQTQEKTFLGGGGAIYQKFDRTGIFKSSLDEWINFMRTAHGMPLKEQKILTQLGSPQKYDTDDLEQNYVEYVRGYFYAHEAGDYKFTGNCDDQMIMQISKYPGSANVNNLQNLLLITEYNFNHFVTFIRESSQSQVRTLEQGYYYYEIALLNYGGSGFFKVDVEVPEIPHIPYPINPTWQIKKLTIKPSQIVPEEIVLTVEGKSGTFKLYELKQNADGTYKQYSKTFDVGEEALAIRDGLYQLPTMRYNRQVTVEIFNAIGNTTTVLAGDAVKYVYTIKIIGYRPQTTSLPRIDGSLIDGEDIVSPYIQINRTVEHSPPLAGTFKVLVNNVPIQKNGGLTDFAYNENPYYIGYALNRLYGTLEIDAVQVIGTSAVDSIELIIEFPGLYEQTQPITLDTSLITGGSVSATIESSVESIRDYSNRPLYSPIPYDFLHIPSNLPALSFKVNEIPTACSESTSCSYQIDASITPSVVSYSRIDEVVTLQVSDPGSLAFTIDDIEVTLLGIPCQDLSGTISSFTCNLLQNSDTTVQLPAGVDKVKVHVKQAGYADNSGLADQDISITVAAMSPATSASGGLIQGSLTGTGFPIDQENAQGLQITICGHQVIEISSISNQLIEFIIPSGTMGDCTGSNSQIVFNSKTASITFAYDDSITPTVTSLSKQSSSPILKTTLIVTGTNFGTSADTKVYLYQNGEQKYQLTIVTISSTQISCILGGGKSGEYDVVVIKDSVGGSVPDSNCKFEYRIFVDSLSISEGHKGGGYQMVVTGRNFATASGSSHVFIGTAMNSYCQIKTITETEITCTVPRMLDDYNVEDILEVVVTGRILQESICSSTCNFKYVEAGSLIVTVTDPNDVTNLDPDQLLRFLKGNTVKIEGSGFSATPITVTVGGEDCTNISESDTEITCEFPSLPYGNYQILIENANGWNYPQIMADNSLILYSYNQNSGSMLGQRVTLSANGLPEDQEQIVVWYISSDIQDPIKLPIISSTQDQLLFEVPAFDSNSQTNTTCIINTTVGTTFKYMNYQYQTAKTPEIAVTDVGNLTYEIQETAVIDGDLDEVWFTLLDSEGNPTSSKYPMTINQNSSTHCSVTPTDSYLPAGTFQVFAHKSIGYAKSQPFTFTISFSTDPTANPIQASFLGGAQLTIFGAGFSTLQPHNNDIRVCGLRADVTSASQTDVTIIIPPLVTEITQNDYKLADEGIITGTPYSDNPVKAPYAFDGSFNTIYDSSNAECYIGYDFGENTVGKITQIRFGPNPKWTIISSYLDGALFQGTNGDPSDKANWQTIFEIDTSEVHASWNSYREERDLKYRYVRFYHTNCQLATIEFTGYKYSLETVPSGGDKNCSVTFSTTNIILTDVVQYKAASTSTVDSLSPEFGPSIGGDTLIISGTNFGSSVSVYIDGIQCTIDSQTTTEIVCTTGLRSSPPEEGNSFVVISDGNTAKINAKPYFYGDRWSEQATWGGEAIPREGDTVYVPKGMTLVVDVESTPVLETIIVEGKIMFSDEIDMAIDAYYFIVIEGEFEAGTEEQEYTHQLTITLHGGYYQKQLPEFGNKVLGCLNCIFNMHGKERQLTWTLVADTINIGDDSFTVLQPVDDWLPGQKIAVASTSFDHYETEWMTIKSVSGTTITTEQAFQYRHYSAVEMYDGEEFPMRAQVGLLSRNIKVQGSEDSLQNKYGSHLMLTGRQNDGLVGKIEYAEFTHCGQPSIVGRYCTHFHMVGEVHKSYVRGIGVHHSFARVLTIHGTHFLIVEKNVGYHVEGHNIFVEDGIETNNVIQDNLMMTSIRSLQMLQSDITVASYWITNPTNTVRRNHAAGGDFYGFWYEIKEHPDGPSATLDICPMGMKLGESRDNVAHSYKRFGLRIFKLSARKFPCITTKDETLEDPYSANPAYESVFENYTLWRNEECGFLGEQLGYTTIRNIRTADSRKGGMQFHKTNYTTELVVAQNCLVVGVSQGNAPTTQLQYYYNNARGIIASRTDGLKFSNIRFYNFETFMTPLQSCSQCWNMKLWVTGGKTTQFENIHYTNISGKYIYWEKWRREIFIDLDGTLTQPFQTLLSLPAQSRATITPYRPSVMITDHCYEEPGVDLLWDNSTFCDQTITLRGILFTNAIPNIDFNAIDMKAIILDDPFEDISLRAPEDFSDEYMIIIKKSMDIKNSWAMPFVTGQYYNIHWKWGIDFTHMAIAPSRLWDSNDGLVLRFNYTDTRELFDILRYYSAGVQQLRNQTDMISPNNCSNGEFYHHRVNYSDPSNQNQSQYLFVCVSGRDKYLHEWIDVNGIRCREFCPDADPYGDRDQELKFWSDASIWPEGVLPAEGQNVTIPYEWNLLLDIDPPILNYLEINGILNFDSSRQNTTLQANYIWVKQGIIKAGSPEIPFDKEAHIILHGEKDSRYLLIDPDASGNKMLAVTGGLQLYGIEPETIWTRLTETALAGATTIKVESVAGWNLGDKLVIAPSYSGRKQFQQIEITAIDANLNEITFDTPLEFEHYGAATSTITNQYGQLDARSSIGILNRNIKISPGEDQNGWGCRVLVYGYNEFTEDLTIPPIWRNGYAKLFGVEFDHCSQYDSSYAALRIENIEQSEIATQISGSSFHDCGAFCFFMDDSMNVQIDNNVFFWARKFLVYVQDVKANYTFTNNLLVGARKRDQVDSSRSFLVDDVACYEQYHTIDFESNSLSHNIIVTDNLCQGSEGEGFVFPLTPCRYLQSYPFIRNTAGSCEVAFMYEKLQGELCLSSKGAIGYASQIGLMANPPGSLIQMIYESMFFTDNQRGMTLRYAHDTDENSLIFRNSFVSGISRLDCPTCYGESKISYCAGGYAVRMLTVTLSGESFPLVKFPTGHDVICTRQAYDFKAFVQNVTFENYFNTNQFIPYCSGMSVFKRHTIASDGTASHHLTNSQCSNCTKESWAYFEKPNVAWRGWFGGCGELDCTGPNNYLIYDQDGTFTGEVSQLLSNNTVIGDGEGCEYISQINGHWCHSADLAVLEYESIAPDFNKRIMWPVYLSYQGGNWTSETNAWREWQWDGSEPMNLRLARFWSVIKMHQNYNLTYTSQPPSDSRFQIQKRVLPDGNESDWAIIRIFFPIPNSIEVLVKNSTSKDLQVKPFVIKKGVAEDLSLHTGFCGANTYNYDNGTIQFMVNGANNCQVRIRLSNFVQLSARININIDDFYNNNGPTSFVTNICAFLGIDTGRLKIVGVYEGSVIVNAQLATAPPNLDDASSTVTDPDAEMTILTAWAEKIKTGVSDKDIDLGGEVLEFTAEVHVFNEDGSIYDPDETETPLIDVNGEELILPIALGVGVSVLVIAIVAGVIYWKRKRAKIHQADSLHNESTAKRDVIQGTTDFNISEVDEFGATSKTHSKWENHNHF